MKKLLFCIAMCLLASATNAQNLRDVVHLKNGSIIKGIIIEQNPPEQIKIQTADGSIFVYKYDEIDKMTREPALPDKKPAPEVKEYGGILGLGCAIGGGGLTGLPLRLNFSRHITFEAGVFLRPTFTYKKTTVYVNGNLVSERTERDFKIPPVVMAGFDFFMSEKYHPNGNKIVKNGMMVRAGVTLIDDYTENMVAIGWARERFRENHKRSSYIFELGAGAIFYKNNSPLGDQIGEDIPIMPLIYVKWHWNWYVVK